MQAIWRQVYLVKRVREEDQRLAMKHGDGKGLREFSDFLLHNKTAMQSTNRLSSLGSEEAITRMLEKNSEEHQ